MNARGQAGFKMKIGSGCQVGFKMNVYVYVLVYVYLARTELVEFCRAPPATLSRAFYLIKVRNRTGLCSFCNPPYKRAPAT